MRFYDDFNILVERHEEAQKAFDGKLPELPTEHFGDIGLFNAEQTGGIAVCVRRRAFMMASILNTSCALTRCSSAFGTPRLLEDLLPAGGG